MKARKILTIVVLALCLGQLAYGSGATPDPVRTAFTYQGLLYDANRVADDQYDFQFKLFDSFAGSKVDGDVNVPDVDVFDGYFTVELDFGDVYDGNERWLEIGVRPGEMNDPNYYTVLEPRQELTATPYALYAKTSGGDNDWMVSGNDMYSIPPGNVGIGLTNPSERLEVDGMISAFRTGTSGIIQVNDKRLSGAAWNLYSGALAEGDFSINEQAALNVPRLYIKAGGNVGIGTESPSEKLNVVGDANITGNLYASSGVRGDSSSSDGVIGWSGNSGKSGVYGYSSAGTGVTGRSEAASGRGVFGKNVPTGNYGILGDPNYGVYGESSSGTAGYLTSSSGYGLIVANGEVGIGAANPNAPLHIGNGTNLTYTNTELLISYDDTEQHGIEIHNNDGGAVWMVVGGTGKTLFGSINTDLHLMAGNSVRLLIDGSSGNVGIGMVMSNPAYKLDVDGDIRATGSVYYGGTAGDSNGTAYDKPDYVFEEGYDVMSIEGVEEYLKKENHLPWMTSAQEEKEENGKVIDMTRMAFETVETAENLQMQVIELNKRIKVLEAENKDMKSHLASIESMLAKSAQ
jgi:hypothetical protein